jgi:hypothetical protein
MDPMVLMRKYSYKNGAIFPTDSPGLSPPTLSRALCAVTAGDLFVVGYATLYAISASRDA